MRPIKGRPWPAGDACVIKAIFTVVFEAVVKQSDMFTDNFLNVWPHLLSGKKKKND